MQTILEQATSISNAIQEIGATIEDTWRDGLIGLGEAAEFRLRAIETRLEKLEARPAQNHNRPK